MTKAQDQQIRTLERAICCTSNCRQGRDCPKRQPGATPDSSRKRPHANLPKGRAISLHLLTKFTKR